MQDSNLEAKLASIDHDRLEAVSGGYRCQPPCASPPPACEPAPCFPQFRFGNDPCGSRPQPGQRFTPFGRDDNGHHGRGFHICI